MRFDLFSSQRLYEALKEADYPDLPSVRTVRRWIKDNAPPDLAVSTVAQLLQLPDIEKEPPTPEWVERLLAGVMALETKESISDEELADAQARAAIYLAAETQRRLLLTSDDD